MIESWKHENMIIDQWSALLSTICSALCHIIFSLNNAAKQSCVLNTDVLMSKFSPPENISLLTHGYNCPAQPGSVTTRASRRWSRRETETLVTILDIRHTVKTIKRIKGRWGLSIYNYYLTIVKPCTQTLNLKTPETQPKPSPNKI